jgi:RsiW-degrading membrane proteinase PrsW (M82 family)
MVIIQLIQDNLATLLPAVQPALIAIIIGSAAPIIWLFFFLMEDNIQTEPKRMVFKVFLTGILAALTAAAIEIIIRGFVLMPTGIEDYSKTTLIVFAFIEELIKFIAVYLAVKGSKYFDEPVDCMIYMITGALGFAAIENALFLSQYIGQNLLEIGIVRSVGATLLHAIASGFVGYYWAKKKFVVGLLLAVSIHTIYNYAISQLNYSAVYATGALVIASFFIFYDFDIMKDEDGQQGIK